MHDARKRIRRPFGVKRWIACQLSFRGWHRARLMQPGRFTELFFLDEATAFAAGHRPCRLCRYADYEAFVDAWTVIHPPAATNADAIEAPLRELPDGTFILSERDEPWLVLGSRLMRWTPAGYAERAPRRPRVTVTVITPPSLVKVLTTERTPLVPFLHPSALDD